jgi:hypothetical protein
MIDPRGLFLPIRWYICSATYASRRKRRELLERFNERVNQELAARENKREPLTTFLDNLD